MYSAYRSVTRWAYRTAGYDLARCWFVENCLNTFTEGQHIPKWCKHMNKTGPTFKKGMLSPTTVTFVFNKTMNGVSKNCMISGHHQLSTLLDSFLAPNTYNCHVVKLPYPFLTTFDAGAHLVLITGVRTFSLFLM